MHQDDIWLVPPNVVRHVVDDVLFYRLFDGISRGDVPVIKFEPAAQHFSRQLSVYTGIEDVYTASGKAEYGAPVACCAVYRILGH